MRKYIRFNHWSQGRYFLAFGMWPIEIYAGVGFSIVICYWELSWYVNPHGFPDDFDKVED